MLGFVTHIDASYVLPPCRMVTRGWLLGVGISSMDKPTCPYTWSGNALNLCRCNKHMLTGKTFHVLSAVRGALLHWQRLMTQGAIHPVAGFSTFALSLS